MYISGAKFEDYRTNISRDILESVFYHFSLLGHHFPNLHNAKTLISLEQKQLCQQGKRYSAVFFKSLQIRSIKLYFNS